MIPARQEPPITDSVATSPAPLVTCRQAAHTYGSGMTAVVAVHSITCEVTQASRIAITGRSGSGKSTLLHMLAGLEAATAGEVRWPAMDASSLRRSHQIAVIFQGPSLLPALDAAENVMLPLLFSGIDDREARRRAREAMASVGVAGLAAKLPQELSGGQAQRVAVARVLASAPQLILADEPTGQLDHTTAHQVIDVLLDTADAIGAALVISTHDPAIAEKLPTQWPMRDGTILRPVITQHELPRPSTSGAAR